MGNQKASESGGSSTTNPAWALVTGASSGIGAATARQLHAAGFGVVLAARRRDRLEQLAADLGGNTRVQVLDVTDADSLAALAADIPSCSVVVCSAGGALGTDTVLAGDDAQWRTMWESNVLGVARTARAMMPALEASGDGRLVVITSVAGHQVYPGGGGYTSAKHGAAAVADTLRLELSGRPVRVIEIAPGLVETEFSVVRFAGDRQRADAVYAGMTPLTADDVADAIVWAVTRPAHVVAARIDLFPSAQASARDVHRT
jgi:NADP-dependent 3-hydroxy acid dehydrogenase YdfG